MKILYRNNNTHRIRTFILLMICLLTALYKLSASPVSPVINCNDSIRTIIDPNNSLTYFFRPAEIDFDASYSWEISDGTTSEKNGFSHTFADSGSYNIKLTRTKDNESCVTTLSLNVENLCSAAFNIDFDSLNEDTYLFTPQILDSNSTYQWEISNGVTSQDSVFEYTFTDPGEYTITLTRITELQESCTKSRGIFIGTGNEECDASFVYHNDNSDSTVYTFIASTQFADLDYNWIIANEVVSTDSVFNYEFTQSGDYLVTLTTFDSEQNECSSEQVIQIGQGEEECDASIAYTNVDGNNYLFMPLKQNEGLFYEWNGDNELVSTDSVFEYTFNEAGIYEVALTKFDDLQNSCSSKELIEVKEPLADSLSIRGSLFADVLPVDKGVV